jgi:hypothetical protein
VAEWGAAVYEERVDAAYEAFAASARNWMDVAVHRGPASVADVYLEVLEGRIPPSMAAIIAIGASEA